MPTVSVELTTFQLASTALTVTEKEAPAVRLRRRAGLARGGARGGGLAREQDLQLGERAAVDRGGRARVRGLRAVRDVGGREGRRAGGLRGDGEGLGAGDERGVGRQRRVGVGGGDADGVGRADGFQLASTALTVTLNEEPAVAADGVPVLPEAVPGAAVSPGSRIWSFANAPPLTSSRGSCWRSSCRRSDRSP